METKVKKTIVFSLITILAVVALVLILFLSQKSASDGSKNKEKEQDSDTLILGFSQIGSESAWRTRNTQSIFEAAAETGKSA